jgi:hypothetical protein
MRLENQLCGFCSPLPSLASLLPYKAGVSIFLTFMADWRLSKFWPREHLAPHRTALFSLCHVPHLRISFWKGLALSFKGFKESMLVAEQKGHGPGLLLSSHTWHNPAPGTIVLVPPCPWGPRSWKPLWQQAWVTVLFLAAGLMRVAIHCGSWEQGHCSCARQCRGAGGWRGVQRQPGLCPLASVRVLLACGSSELWTCQAWTLPLSGTPHLWASYNRRWEKSQESAIWVSVHPSTHPSICSIIYPLLYPSLCLPIQSFIILSHFHPLSPLSIIHQ